MQPLLEKMNKKIVGIFLVLVTNICYIGNNYLVKWAELGPGEVSLIRGLIQILVFSTIIYVQRKRSSKDETSPSLKQWILICVYGFFSSTMAYACIMAVSLMPISDLIVICYLCPVFSVILDALVLKRPLTVLSVLLCIIIVIGDVLVVQPSFIFSEKSVPTNLQNSSNEIELELEHEYNSNQTSSVLKDMIGADSDTNYMIGVCLCIYSALAASIDNVVQVLVSRNDEKKIVSRSHWVTSTGVWGVILSIISLPLLPNPLLTSPQSMSLVTVSMLFVSAFIIILAIWWLVTAVSLIQHPTLVTMLRTTEIIMSLVTESLYWGHLPSLLSASGSILVMLSVAGMAAHDKMIDWYQKHNPCCSNSKLKENNNVETC